MTAHDQYREDLPLYAVGALTAEESARLEGHLAECAECRSELASFENAAAQVALAVEPAVPPAPLRPKLLARLADQRASAVARRPKPARGSWFWVPAFAALLLALASLVAWQRGRELARRNRELAGQLERNGQLLERARELIETLSASDAERIALVPAGAKPQPEARAIYSPHQRSLVLLADHLNALPTHKIYELWLLPASGATPMPAGTFKPDERGSAALVLTQFANGIAAKGFAITIENEPGSSTPTMPLILSGTS
jgi:anti-sigma-K factor RskA